MRRGQFLNIVSICALGLASACGGENNNDAGNGDGDGTSTETAGNEQSSAEEEGEAEAEGDGDGDGDAGDGDGDAGDGDGDAGDGDGDGGDGDGDGDGGDGDGDGDGGDGDGDGGDGDGDGGDGDGDGDGDVQCGDLLMSTVRDFKIEHPDFQYVIGVDPGIVQDQLGNDNKPVYAGNPNTPTTTGAANFNQWYNDVDGVNQAFEVPIQLMETMPGIYQYANNDFFPIDNLGWGNEGNNHNFHFTLELHTMFQYNGGEVFGFEGDDDLWVFVNGELAMDLGGVHGPMAANVDMDAQANNLGLQIGGVYPIDFFFAERHTTQSNFTITTTIGCFSPQ